MKYFGFFLVFIGLLATTNLKASQLSEVKVETKIAAFFPSSKIIKNIYSDTMPYYELEITKPFYKNWQATLGVGYLSNAGHPIGCKNKTSFHLIPVTLGLTYFYSIKSHLNMYTGAGIC